jgi:Ca2+-transporting ATPase
VTLASYMIGRALHGPGRGSNGWAFTTLTVAQLLHALSSRSGHSILRRDKRLPANPYVDAAVAGLLGMQAVVSLLPGARSLFGLTPLGPSHLLAASLLGVGSFVLQEALKPPPVLAKESQHE